MLFYECRKRCGDQFEPISTRGAMSALSTFIYEDDNQHQKSIKSCDDGSSISKLGIDVYIFQRV